MAHIDLTDSAFWKNPYPLYAELRRNHPVCRVEPGGAWAVSRHEDVVYVMRNPEIFSSEGLRMGFRPKWLDDNPAADTLFVLDGPEHMRLRRLVTPAFGLRVVSLLEPHARQKADELADSILMQPEVEFVMDFAVAVPANVIGMLLGIDSSLQKHFKRWSDDIVSITAMPVAPEPARIEEIRTTIADMRRYISTVIKEHRKEPRDDLISDLIRATVEGQSLTDDELMSFLFGLLLGGLETTTHLISAAIHILAERPDVFARLRADLSLIPNFAEEVLRLQGSVQMIPRVATTDVEIAGVTIPQGAWVLPIVASANRDQQKFPDGDHFNLESKARHMSFGDGVHHCIGAALARMEARIAIEAVVKRFSSIELLSRELEWTHSLVSRGLTSLPLRFLPIASGLAK